MPFARGVAFVERPRPARGIVRAVAGTPRNLAGWILRMVRDGTRAAGYSVLRTRLPCARKRHATREWKRPQAAPIGIVWHSRAGALSEPGQPNRRWNRPHHGPFARRPRQDPARTERLASLTARSQSPGKERGRRTRQSRHRTPSGQKRIGSKVARNQPRRGWTGGAAGLVGSQYNQLWDHRSWPEPSRERRFR